ncbi:oxidoreductase (plasmid) [Acaryochloris sp. 'Moss Beach']|uniref:NADH-quinone oxidoreductase subunit B family protein n=1 Tax=Acaryochloris TaxID=155977 RepID=UPI001BAF0126|nr:MULTISPECIES: oxidoreductase [Acaryochloris]QUY46070.1 oxidoreductase [Acaryochloris marina S15]UJB72597.1 oxidoreductase [Acaryochloris sp. 'Moss Beach']
MAKLKLATVWLGGCSGCHMSFLDLDEWLFELAHQIDLVYSPFMDAKQYPQEVDVALVEGAIANTDHWEMIHRVRDCTQYLIAFGDCAVTGNVTALRNVLGTAERVLERSYIDMADLVPQIPAEEEIVPPLLDRVQPVHTVVPVDLFLPGCPPSPSRIQLVLEALLQGKKPQLEGRDQIKFG